MYFFFWSILIRLSTFYKRITFVPRNTVLDHQQQTIGNNVRRKIPILGYKNHPQYIGSFSSVKGGVERKLTSPVY